MVFKLIAGTISPPVGIDLHALFKKFGAPVLRPLHGILHDFLQGKNGANLSYAQIKDVSLNFSICASVFYYITNGVSFF